MARRAAPSGNRRSFGIKLKGAEGLADALRALGNDRMVKRILKKALMEEAEPAAREARRLAPKGKTGRMADKINVSTTLSRRQRAQRRKPNLKNGLVAEVFLGAGAKGPAHLIEFGTGLRRHKSGKSTGYVPAHPYMRPAWEKWKFRILDRFAFRLWHEIERAAKRLAAKQKRSLK